MKHISPQDGGRNLLLQKWTVLVGPLWDWANYRMEDSKSAAKKSSAGTYLWSLVHHSSLFWGSVWKSAYRGRGWPGMSWPGSQALTETNADRDELPLASSGTFLIALCHGARQVCRGNTRIRPCKKEAAGYVCYSPSSSGRIWCEDCSVRRQATLPGKAARALLMSTGVLTTLWVSC